MGFGHFHYRSQGKKLSLSALLWTHKNDLLPIWQLKPIIFLPPLPHTPSSALNSAMLRNNMFWLPATDKNRKRQWERKCETWKLRLKCDKLVKIINAGSRVHRYVVNKFVFKEISCWFCLWEREYWKVYMQKDEIQLWIPTSDSIETQY